MAICLAIPQIINLIFTKETGANLIEKNFLLDYFPMTRRIC